MSILGICIDPVLAADPCHNVEMVLVPFLKAARPPFSSHLRVSPLVCLRDIESVVVVLRVVVVIAALWHCRRLCELLKVFYYWTCIIVVAVIYQLNLLFFNWYLSLTGLKINLELFQDLL